MLCSFLSKELTVNTLEQAIDAVKEGNTQKATQLLTQLQHNFSEQPLNEVDVLSQLVCQALLNRLNDLQLDAGNLYLENQQMQIKLFNFMAEHFPLVTIPTNLANALIFNKIADQQHVTILDIGIGTGRQMVALFRLLAEAMALPEHIHLIGIDPSSTNLLQAEVAFNHLITELGINLTFTPHCQVIENFKPKDWQALQGLKKPCIINAAFSLHHIVPPMHSYLLDPRDYVLRGIRSLNPDLVVITEPHANHNIADLQQRYKSCSLHYGLVFQVLDEMQISPDTQYAIKKLFFAREIENIMANDEFLHTERHEPGETWHQRLLSAGFQTFAAYNDLEIEAFEEQPVSIEDNGCYLSLCKDHQPIVNLFVMS